MQETVVLLTGETEQARLKTKMQIIGPLTWGYLSEEKLIFTRDAHFRQAPSTCSRTAICFPTFHREQAAMDYQSCDQNIHIQYRIRGNTAMLKESREPKTM